jgi:hypothetical protein
MAFDGRDESLGRLEEAEVRICADGDAADADAGAADDSASSRDAAVGW